MRPIDAQGLTLPATRGKLDPDLIAFVEALARYAARKDHAAQDRRAAEGAQ
jgi:hypothetical protein